MALQQGVEQFNQQYQTAAQHQKGASQEDQTYSQVRQRAVHKEMPTCAERQRCGIMRI